MSVHTFKVIVFAAILAVTVTVHAKKKDPVADSIAKARAQSDAKAEAKAVAADEGATLKELIGESKLVASSDAKAPAKSDDAARAASAVMAEGGDGTNATAVNTAAPESQDESTAPSAAGGIAEAAQSTESDAVAAVAAGIAAKPDVSKLSEKDIPVLTSKPKAAKASSSTVARVLASIGVLLLLTISVTYGIRKYTKRTDAKTAATKIRILTQHHLGPKKSIAIIQVAGESLLVGITDHSITMLKTLSLLDEEVPESTPRDFNSALGDYEFENEEQEIRAQRGQDDFAMRGLSDIRDSVSRRLKGLKQI